MAGMKGLRIALVTLAFTGSIGMTFVILACALNQQWWPMIVVLFYILAPIPTMIARRQQEQYSTTNQTQCMDFAIFLTMSLVVSSFALPIVLARSSEPSTIDLDACYLTLAGNIVIYLTYIGYFLTLFQDDPSYRIW